MSEQAQVHDELSGDGIAHATHRLEDHRVLRLDDGDVGLGEVLGIDMRNRDVDGLATEAGRIVGLTLHDGVEPRVLDVAARAELGAELLEEVLAVGSLEVEEDELGLEQAGIHSRHNGPFG